MTKSEQHLRHLVFDKLIDIPIYQLKNISTEEFKHFLSEYYDGLTKNNLTGRKTIGFASRTFYRKYRNLSTLSAIVILFFILIIIKLLFFQLTVIGIFLFLLLAFLFSVHVMNFAIWHLDIESQSNIVVSKLIEINKSIYGFRTNRPRHINKKANEIVREIIENEISRLDYKRGQKGQIAFASFMFALFFSCMYVYIMGDSLNDEIIWIANFLGFGDFDLVKNLNTQEVALALFTFAGLFMSYRIESDLEKKRLTLKESLAKIEEQSSKRSNYLKNIYNRISSWFF